MMGRSPKILTVEETAKKQLFIRCARAEFKPGARQSCFVCGKYRGLTQAHHVYPLALQFDDGRTYADHEYYWLCPTHHAAVHLHISSYDKPREMDVGGVPEEEMKAIRGISRRFLALWKEQQNKRLEHA
jgi:hypothetical protein